ncbi:MAG: flagellar basal body protein, partial [Nitrospirota bacterium]|nr:flagellar basal body protein [Nitrospirota bacterium]
MSGSGINNIFEMGRLGIQAFQRGLSVTAHNISNASTEGFSRQDVVLEAARPLGGIIPTGVRVAEVRRNVDQFVEAQL